jgi:hypothetical protein
VPTRTNKKTRAQRPKRSSAPTAVTSPTTAGPSDSHHRPSLPNGWRVCDLGDALAGTGEKPPWIIRELLLAQSATQVSAHPHSMKSLAWLAACIESVAKDTVWGHFEATAVNSSLFIETEDPQWVVEHRVQSVAKGLGLKTVEHAPGFHYLRTGPFDLEEMQRTLKDMLHY